MSNSQEEIDFESYVAKTLVPDVEDCQGIPILLLTCMDHRYPNRIVNTMDSSGLRGKYDHLVLAGAGLGVVHKDEWRITFFDQLRFAIDHHHVRELVIFEHRDCGAYREFLGITPDDPVEERQAHIEQSSNAIKITLAAFPELEKVRCLLLPVEGIEELPLEK